MSSLPLTYLMCATLPAMSTAVGDSAETVCLSKNLCLSSISEAPVLLLPPFKNPKLKCKWSSVCKLSPCTSWRCRLEPGKMQMSKLRTSNEISKNLPWPNVMGFQPNKRKPLRIMHTTLAVLALRQKASSCKATTVPESIWLSVTFGRATAGFLLHHHN